MGRKTILLSLFIMPFFVSTHAQNAKETALHWKIAAELPSLDGKSRSLGFAGPVTGVHNNVMVVAGGANFPNNMPWQGGKKKYYDDVYVYLKNKNTLKLHKKLFKLPFPVAYAACSSTPAGIIYAGGENEQGISSKVILLQWDGSNETIIDRELPELPVGLTNASATFKDGIVYVAGGETTGFVSDRLYSLNINNPNSGWTLLATIPKPVSHAVLVALDNGSHDASLYLVGGRMRNSNGISDLYNSVFQYSIRSGQWQEKRQLPYSLSAGTGIACTNRLIIFGGDKGVTFHKTEQLIAAINKQQDSVKKLELARQKNELQSAHPGFSKEILQYDVRLDEWIVSGSMPFDTPVTTTAFVWENMVIIPSGEVKAGIRTPKILMARTGK